MKLKAGGYRDVGGGSFTVYVWQWTQVYSVLHDREACLLSCASSIPFAPPRLITEQHCSLNICDIPAVFNEIGNSFFRFERDQESFCASISEIRNRFFLFDRNQESFFPLWQKSGIVFLPLWQRSGIPFSFLTGIRNHLFPVWQRSVSEFLNLQGAQESIPRNQFRQPM